MEKEELKSRLLLTRRMRFVWSMLESTEKISRDIPWERRIRRSTFLFGANSHSSPFYICGINSILSKVIIFREIEYVCMYVDQKEISEDSENGKTNEEHQSADVYNSALPIEKGFNFRDERIDNGNWMNEDNAEILAKFFRLLALCHTV